LTAGTVDGPVPRGAGSQLQLHHPDRPIDIAVLVEYSDRIRCAHSSREYPGEPLPEGDTVRRNADRVDVLRAGPCAHIGQQPCLASS